MKLGLALLNAIVTYFFTKSLTHDGLVEEDRAVRPYNLAKMNFGTYLSLQFRQYLEDNGYDTSQMGLLDSSTTASRAEVDARTDVSSESEKKV